MKNNTCCWVGFFVQQIKNPHGFFVFAAILANTRGANARQPGTNMSTFSGNIFSKSELTYETGDACIPYKQLIT